jgi:tRNA threonylcarbamoyladenosine biosynthesis protein TsaE
MAGPVAATFTELVSLRRRSWRAKSWTMNPDSPLTARIALPDLAATAALGARIAIALQPGDLVALAGDLGAGKTTLARGILTALGLSGPMPSPTFTLVQTYEAARLVVRHYDLYRIEDPREIAELGLDEALEDGAVLVEWPERAGGLLPDDALIVSLTMPDAVTRQAELSGPARWAAALRGLSRV